MATTQAYQILTLVGGISENSINRKLAEALEELMPDEFEMLRFDIKELPFYSQDIEQSPPQSVRELKNLIRICSGVLLITPEYNRSFPGVLKNAIDWGSRPWGDNSWSGKPAAVIGASSGNIGTFGAQHHLRQVLVYLNMPTLAQPEVYLNGSKAFDEAGTIKEGSTRKFLESFVQAYCRWVLKFAPNPSPRPNLERDLSNDLAL